MAEMLLAPAKQAEFDAIKLFVGVTDKNSAARFDEIVKNSTFDKLPKIISAADAFKAITPAEMKFRERVLEHVLPFRISMAAKTDSKLTEKEFEAKCGKYGANNDCYTYLMDKVTESAKGLSENELTFTNKNPPYKFTSIEAYEKHEKKYGKPDVWVLETSYQKKGKNWDQFNIVPGDYIRADKSLFQTDRPHWGIFVQGDEKTPDEIIVDRGNKLYVHTLDEFLEHTETFAVRKLYGGVTYQQHYHVSTCEKEDSTGKAKTHYKTELKKGNPEEFINNKQGPLPEGLIKK